jgi:phospholipase C
LPNNEPQAATGVGTVAACVRYASEHPDRRLIVCGHTDYEPDTSYLLSLSRERAKTAHALIRGDHDEFARVCSDSHAVEDYQQILTFVAATRGWPCDPRGIDGQHGADTTRALIGFQKRYNAEAQPATPLVETGALDQATWAAFADCYDFALAGELGTDQSGLAQLRARLQLIDPEAVGCGNFHPATDKQYVSTSNRRVELLFFQSGDEPQMDCHAGGCQPDRCQIYDPKRYTQLHVPVMPSPLPWIARWDRDEASDGDTAQMLLTAPGLAAGETLVWDVSVNGQPAGTTQTTSQAGAATAPWSDWSGPSGDRRFTFIVRGAGRVIHATHEVLRAGRFLWLLDARTAPPTALAGRARAYGDPQGSGPPIFEAPFDNEGKLAVAKLPSGTQKLEVVIDGSTLSGEVVLDYFYEGKDSAKTKLRRDGERRDQEAMSANPADHVFAIQPIPTSADSDDSKAEATVGPFLWLLDLAGKAAANSTWSTFGRLEDANPVTPNPMPFDSQDGNVPLTQIKNFQGTQRIQVSFDDAPIRDTKGPGVEDKGHYLIRKAVDNNGKPDDSALLIAGQFGPGQPDILRHVPTEDTTITVSKWSEVPEGKGFQHLKHFFVLMLENRSFDHLLGHNPNLGEVDGTLNSDGTHRHDLTNPQWIPDANSVLQASGAKTIGVNTGARDPMIVDPGHEFLHAHFQLKWESDVTKEGPNDLSGSRMNGFVNAYLNRLVDRSAGNGQWDADAESNHKNGNVQAALSHAAKSAAALAEDVMLGFPRTRVPVLNTLAESFAVSDRWFSSLPGPTWPNRLFFHAGTAGGLEDSPTSAMAHVVGPGFDLDTIYLRIDQQFSSEPPGTHWKIYSEDGHPQANSFRNTPFVGLPDKGFKKLKADLASVYPSLSASFTFLEPDYGAVFNPKVWPPSTGSDITRDFSGGTSQHPVSGIHGGEQLIKTVYDMLKASSIWEDSVLIILYDEHGGFYDHVRPPAAVPPDTNTKYRVHPPPGSQSEPVWREAPWQPPFAFANYGVRVPAVIVSPRIPKGVVDHTIYDHTSVARTVRKRFGIGTPLSDRERSANDFAHLFTLETPRPLSDMPDVTPPAASLAAARVELADDAQEDSALLDMPLRGNAVGFLVIAAKLAAEKRPGERDEIMRRLEAVKTVRDARALMDWVRPFFDGESPIG